MAETTTRAYTLKLSGNGNWQDLIWSTHVAVNRATQVWGDWLLTLRGGLPAAMADDDLILPITDAVLQKELKQRKLKDDAQESVRSELEQHRRQNLKVLLALSWLAVESPAALVPDQRIVASGSDSPADRQRKVHEAFHAILSRLHIQGPQKHEWIDACEPALTARIRDDAVWVDRSQCFADLQQQCPGLTAEWAAATLFGFLGEADDYFALPEEGEGASTESKDFVQKAGGWLSRNWGSGEKSDAGSIGAKLSALAQADPSALVGSTAIRALASLLTAIGQLPSENDSIDARFKQLKQAIGWKGRSSKGAMALEKIRACQTVSVDLWQQVAEKLRQEAADQSAKAGGGGDRQKWMQQWRDKFERRLGMPYRTTRDLIWEHGVAFDHALRRVSAAHTWIKRAEVERRQFRDDAAKIKDVAKVPPAARDWLDSFCAGRSTESGSVGDYLIRKRAIDGWDKVIRAWTDLGAGSTRSQRIAAARDVQKNLDDNDKFGDIQLFAGFGDDDDAKDEDARRPCLSDDAAFCVWHDANGKPSAQILKDYVAATVADHNQRRFKVPAYRHPDPLRHPVFVDFGNSRWKIEYSALKCAQQRQKYLEQVRKAKTDKAREKLQQQLDANPSLYGVELDTWNGQAIEPLPLRWNGARLSNDLDLAHFGATPDGNPVTRADRLGRAVAGQGSGAAVTIAAVFDQKDWNGRLQVPREQLDRLADLVYGKCDGKRCGPDYGKLDHVREDPRSRKLWKRLRWFLTTSAKLQSQGPWLDYAGAGLPNGIEYRKGRSGHYLDHAANKGRKGRARLVLARLPGLRVLSLDLGHRYGAACVVWETLSLQTFRAEITDREIIAGGTDNSDLFCHTRHVDDRGKTRTTIYRRIGPDVLPDRTRHPAPWARLDRQFLVKLQGEDRPARRALPNEIKVVNDLRDFVGLPPLAETPRIDDLQAGAVRIARLGLRRLGDAARIAFAVTAVKKPISGGRDSKDLTPQQRVQYTQDALILWQELAKSVNYKDDWAADVWQTWVIKEFGGPQPVDISDDVPRSERKKKVESIRTLLAPVAEKLSDPELSLAVELHQLWHEHWQELEIAWRKHLRQLRKLILPRKADWVADRKSVRQVGGLSVKRLKTIRDLYQVLKAFRMRPEPVDLRKNVPELGDETLAKFGRRILDQLERLREQRIKQLASRVVEAALGAGRMQNVHGRDRKRPSRSVDRPCHAIVVENLENYRPEDSRLRRENRQLMDWAARNVRKYIVEGCELHGLHFVEVSPSYTSRQDSRTGAPGIRCEDVSRDVLEQAMQRLDHAAGMNAAPEPSESDTKVELDVRRWMGELRRVAKKVHDNEDLSPRDGILASLMQAIANVPAQRATIRLPRRGGDLFVSAVAASPAARGVQADLNAAANIGLKAISDPDWLGAWWFVLANLATGQPAADKIHGCPVWAAGQVILTPKTPEAGGASARTTRKPSVASAKPAKTDVYAWNPRFWPAHGADGWSETKAYWAAVEKDIADRLRRDQTEPDNPF